MFHGCSTDPIGGAGPLKYGDWLVQTVSAILIGGPYISSAHAAGVSDVIGQLRTATGRSVLVTEWRPQTPQYPLNDKIMDHSYWTRTEQRASTRPEDDNKKPSVDQWKARRSDREWERERERGRDRTSQSKLSWSLTITSHTFPLPPPYAFLFSKLCFLSFLLWAAAVEVSVQHSPLLSTVFLSFFSPYVQSLSEHPIKVESST